LSSRRHGVSHFRLQEEGSRGIPEEIRYVPSVAARVARYFNNIASEKFGILKSVKNFDAVSLEENSMLKVFLLLQMY
jgi:hypothetical protein